MLDHDVMGADVHTATDEGDARRGRGLARNGDEGVAQTQGLATEVDDPADFEHDDPRPLGLDGFTQ